ncbi:uncharacterized protein UV8b_03460 [Ustilaginoidea virens]|uniref:C6 transcription factor n=1 Tax=Ustilaginoidea virens TaxID=1159556 RepID=A0A8E5HPD7_USTVR|nr:uncharacterized protein UV8b_03460 [Ustilaginoidea virens]QUC19219.1 hypothetical protein UV8b_03460 [Ustilaginoidea virens]
MARAFTHTPPFWALVWMAVSLPLVAWDTLYVLGRPHTMPGGCCHWPWSPYKLYGEIDHVYGWKAFRDRSGFTGAQALLNLVETAMYLAYLRLWRSRRQPAGAVAGRVGALALLLGFSAAVMTLSKTVLYWAHEYFSGFANIGHNAVADLVLLWIVPNGAWLVGPSYMIYALGSEILDNLEGVHVKKD